MSRLPDLRKDELDSERLAVWEAVCRARGAETLNEGGALIGPFNAFVHSPDIGLRLLDLGNALHFRTSLPTRTIELVILTIGARWKAEFEWWAHSRRARENGLDPSLIEAIGSDSVPVFADRDDEVLYRLARQLGQTGRIDDDTYHAAEKIVGYQGLVEVIALCGYYTLISFLLNGFDVQLPAGEAKRWAP